jgi:hypothetical protein
VINATETYGGKALNDFTKEELFRIFEWALNIADEYPEQFDSLDREIYNKLEAMIDVQK